MFTGNEALGTGVSEEDRTLDFVVLVAKFVARVEAFELAVLLAERTNCARTGFNLLLPDLGLSVGGSPES